MRKALSIFGNRYAVTAELSEAECVSAKHLPAKRLPSSRETVYSARNILTGSIRTASYTVEERPPCADRR